MKKLLTLLLAASMAFSMVACGNTTTDKVSETSSEASSQAVEPAATEAAATTEEVLCSLEDGVYKAKFTTDSTMFHVNETLEDWGELTVAGGKMTIHVTLAGKGITNLFLGLAEDADNDGAALLEPTTDSVTYPDGLTEEVNGFDIPVPYLDKEFDLALIGKKGKWYDHKVMVSEVTAVDSQEETITDIQADGEYQAEVTLIGGSGKATVESPATVTAKDGAITIKLVWSSKNYDYMIVDGQKYLNESEEGQPSSFTIPVLKLGEEFDVIGDTVAMSKPHEIEYKLLVKIIE